MSKVYICCPNCGWEPDGRPKWKCSDCGTKWDTFSTNAECPTCGRVYQDTGCPNCHQTSLNKDWYTTQTVLKPKPKPTSWMFWKNTNRYPVTDHDKVWIEETLAWLSEWLGPAQFKSLSTVAPGAFRQFSGTEGDAVYLLEIIARTMQVETWEIQLMFFSERTQEFSEGIRATPSDKLKQSWSSQPSKFIDNGFGNKEIWIELEQLKDEASLISLLSHEMARFKLLADFPPEEIDELLIAITAVTFGFGLFMANSYFKFAQWQGNSHQGWRMRKNGYLPEQVIAYAMAWLAINRNEDISWKQYLNKTTLKYFEQSYQYIDEYPDEVNWW